MALATRPKFDPVAKAVDIVLDVLLCEDHQGALKLLDGLHFTTPEVSALISEVATLRAQGVPQAAFQAWHRDLAAALVRLTQPRPNAAA
jgi:hypothetical protein